MDYELQVIIEATMQLLGAPSNPKPTWPTLSDQMTRNSLIEPVGGEQCSTKALLGDGGNSVRLHAIHEPLTKQQVPLDPDYQLGHKSHELL